MGFVILTRNPSNKKLVAIIADDGEDDVAEFATEREAEDVAKNTTVCRAWGYQVLEVE